MCHSFQVTLVVYNLFKWCASTYKQSHSLYRREVVISWSIKLVTIAKGRSLTVWETISISEYTILMQDKVSHESNCENLFRTDWSTVSLGFCSPVLKRFKKANVVCFYRFSCFPKTPETLVIEWTLACQQVLYKRHYAFFHGHFWI